VNTLLQKLARTSAFSLSVVVFLSSPSSDLNLNTFLQCDWNDILKRKNAGQQFDIFMTKFNEAKNKYIPHMNTKPSNKALELAYFPKILGLLLTCFAISFSILAFAFLIALLT
jgi:ABC-type phosphate/phosphonate transport system permease subunit